MTEDPQLNQRCGFETSRELLIEHLELEVHLDTKQEQTCTIENVISTLRKININPLILVLILLYERVGLTWSFRCCKLFNGSHGVKDFLVVARLRRGAILVFNGRHEGNVSRYIFVSSLYLLICAVRF